MSKRSKNGLTTSAPRQGFHPAINVMAMLKDPALWFSQLELQFRLRGIDDDATKFTYVASALDDVRGLLVRDILQNPPSSNQYDTLKNALICRLSVSEERRLRQILEHVELGDRTPSQFLLHLRELGGTAVSDKLLRTLWSGRLPQNVKLLLATMPETASLDQVAELADRAFEASSVPALVAVQPAAATTASPSVVAAVQLPMDMTSLAQMIREIVRDEFFRSRPRSRSTSRKRVRPRSGSRARNSKGVTY